MTLKVAKAEIWSTTIEDRTGGAAEKLEPLTAAGANFEFVFARRMPEQPGRGLCLVAPVKGKKVTSAAMAAGFVKAPDIHSLRIEGGNKAGSAARITRALAGAGISFRGLSASALGTKFVGYVAFDSAADAEAAAKVLRRV
jgi:hypothetical protein